MAKRPPPVSADLFADLLLTPAEPAPAEPAPAELAEPARCVAVGEVLAFPLRLLTDLPLPTTLLLCQGDGRVWVVSTSAAGARRAAELDLPIFSGAEARVLAVGAEQGRAFEADLSRWLQRKVSGLGYELTVGEVFAGVRERVRPAGWTVGQVLAAVGGELLGVAVGDEQALVLLADKARAA